MKRISLGVLCLSIVTAVFAHHGEDDYAVSRISPVLIKNANAVLRLEEISFDINGTKEAVERNHYVITILNESGDDWAQFTEYYDKLREISSAEGYLYDASGKLLKKVRLKDMQDLSAVSDISLMEDNRVKRHNFYYKVYPYTIEYTVTTVNKNTLFFPMWSPQGSEKISVEKSNFTIGCPIDYQFRYKAYNCKSEPVTTTVKNKKYTSWFVTNMPALVKESYAPRWHELTTVVIFGPSDFQVGDYTGSMNNWQDFGKFVYSLKNGRDQLPDNVRQAVHQIADGMSDPKKKTQALYEYMQKNTRYISIQLGIGGWQPFDASYVATKGYGDCKALSNYMFSILKEAGIPSYYTLIRAGRNAGYITEDFPSQQFNHVILCVPAKNDTTWLECTSQTLPAGYLSDFTSDRYALLIDENGGKLVRTPKYSMQDNLEIRNTKAVLDEEATLKAKVITTYRAEQQDYYHQMIHALAKDKIKEQLQKQLDFATYDVLSFDYKEQKSALPVIEESLEISVSNYASVTGKRLFIMPNVMTRTGRKLKADEERKYDIVLQSEYTDIDTAEIEIPNGFVMESLPSPVTVETKFGRYSNSVKMEGNKVYYYRKMENFSGRYPAKDYASLVSFYDAIYKADRNRVVLVKGN
jgi:transglutaminase-like putative cysteine protease